MNEDGTVIPFDSARARRATATDAPSPTQVPDPSDQFPTQPAAARAFLGDAAHYLVQRADPTVTLADVARELGMDVEEIHAHFDSVEDLVRAALNEERRIISETLHQHATRTGTTAIERVRGALSAAAERFVTAKPSLIELMHLRTYTLKFDSDGTEAQRTRALISAQVEHLVREGQNEGSIRRDVHAQLVTTLVVGTVLSLPQLLGNDPDYSTVQIARELTSVVFEGIATR